MNVPDYMFREAQVVANVAQKERDFILKQRDAANQLLAQAVGLLRKTIRMTYFMGGEAESLEAEIEAFLALPDITAIKEQK